MDTRNSGHHLKGSFVRLLTDLIKEGHRRIGVDKTILKVESAIQGIAVGRKDKVKLVPTSIIRKCTTCCVVVTTIVHRVNIFNCSSFGLENHDHLNGLDVVFVDNNELDRARFWR